MDKKGCFFFEESIVYSVIPAKLYFRMIGSAEIYENFNSSVVCSSNIQCQLRARKMGNCFKSSTVILLIVLLNDSCKF